MAKRVTAERVAAEPAAEDRAAGERAVVERISGHQASDQGVADRAADRATADRAADRAVAGGAADRAVADRVPDLTVADRAADRVPDRGVKKAAVNRAADGPAHSPRGSEGACGTSGLRRAPDPRGADDPRRAQDEGDPRRREPLWRDVIGEVLRRERQAQARTLQQVADRARISMPYLSELERGRKEASSEVLAAAATALGLSLSELVGLARDRLGSYERAAAAQMATGARSREVLGLAA